MAINFACFLALPDYLFQQRKLTDEVIASVLLWMSMGLISPPFSFPMTAIFTFRKKRFHKVNMLDDEVRDLLREDYGDAIQVWARLSNDRRDISYVSISPYHLKTQNESCHF